MFRFLRKFKRSIICLQETHWSESIVPVLECQWGHTVVTSGHSSQETGVAILFTKDFEGTYQVIYRDRLGRCLIIKVSRGDHTVFICNVYFPTADKESTQLMLLSQIEEQLSPLIGEEIIIVGDFNVIMNRELEGFNLVGQGIRNSGFRKELLVFLDNLALCDPWRSRHQREKTFTWSRANKASRLDYIFTPSHCLNSITSTNYVDVPFSDHRLISVGFNIKAEARGKGFWRMNNSLLENPEIYEEVVELIGQKKVEYEAKEKFLKWGLIKFNIRELSTVWQSKLRKERNALQAELQERIEFLSQNPEGLEQNLEELNSLKRELFTAQLGGERIRLIKSNCQWALYGGKPTKFFLNLEKQNQLDKSISQLADSDGNLISGRENILAYGEKHFRDIYTPRMEQSEEPDPFSSKITSTLEDMDRDVLEEDFTLIELEEALKAMKLNKCPGSDGINVEFYRKMWPEVGSLVLDSLNDAFHEGMLSPEQRRGIITLLPKKNRDRRFLSNWRPITLLNIDYKLLAKCISRRLHHIIPRLIHENQVGFIPGRFIGTNIRNINDIIEYLQGLEVGGFVVSMDYSMVFDKIDQKFLSKVLRSYNFGPHLIKWIKTLYNGAEACVLNNGYTSNWFPVNTGLRQGCPLSPFLFVLCVEKLAHSIRTDPDIQGISILQNTHKLMQYADDLTLFLKDPESIEVTLNKLDEFEKYSGLKININKSYGLRVNTDAILGNRGGEIYWSNKISVLGANFYNDKTEAQHMISDFDVYVKKMEHVCAVWNKRKLPLKGKVVILNTLVYPIIYYAATNRVCPKVVVDRVKHLTTRFLWNGNVSKISLLTLTQDTANGGLRLHDFEKRLAAAKLAWAKRMLKSGTGFWIDYIKYSLNIDTIFEIFLRRKRWLRTDISQFYKDILSEWSKIYNSPPDTDISCRSEPLWNNRFIDLRSLNKLQVIWKTKGIWRLNDVLENGLPYTAETFYNRYGIRHAQKLFDKLYRYIPDSFLEVIIPVFKQNKTIGLYIKDLDDKMVDFDILSTKQLYRILLVKKKTCPNSTTEMA